MNIKQEAINEANLLSLSELLESIKCKTDKCKHIPLIDYEVLLERLQNFESKWGKKFDKVGDVTK